MVAPVRAPLEQLRFSIDSLVNDPMFSSANIGLLIVNSRTRDTLYSRNAGKLFMPASNQKLLTSAVALHQLGPNYRFRTVVARRGELSADGVLNGDLVVIGNGDPTISDRMRGNAMLAMQGIADSIIARGVKRITGTLRPGGDALPDAIYGYGWELDDLRSSGAPTDELLFNEGQERYIRHTAAGDSIDLIGTQNPTLSYLAALDTAFGARGVTSGGTSVVIVPLTERLDTLYAFDSPPLKDILGPFLKPSQNQIGEILLKTLGRERLGVGVADSGAVVVTRQLREWGVDSLGVLVYDGSGLSRHNLVTPETIVKILTAMEKDTAFQVFYDALPIAGIDGTIRTRMRNTPAASNLRAKTGTIEFVRSLSGYVTDADNDRLIFSFLSNHFVVPVAQISRVQDAVGVLMATYKSSRPH